MSLPLATGQTYCTLPYGYHPEPYLEISVLGEYGYYETLLRADYLEVLDFHEEVALCHINGIFLYNVDNVYIQADGYHQLYYSGFVACDLFV